MLRRFSPLIDLCRTNLETCAASGAEIPVYSDIAAPNPQLLWRIDGSPDDDTFVFPDFLASLLKTWINGQVITLDLVLLDAENWMQASGVIYSLSFYDLWKNPKWDMWDFPPHNLSYRRMRATIRACFLILNYRFLIG